MPDIAGTRKQAEQQAIRRREFLEELLRDTCIHLHSPETCHWCIEAELDAACAQGVRNEAPARDEGPR